MRRILSIGSRSTFYRGPVGRAGLHRHSAAAIVAAISPPLRVRSDDGVRHDVTSMYVPPDVPHEFDSDGDVAVFFAEPTSTMHRRFESHYVLRTDEITLDPALPLDWARFEWGEDDTIHDEIERELLPLGPVVADGHDPRVAAVVAHMRAHLDRSDGAADLAALVHVSPSRLSALFRTHVGMPIRRYRVWLRLHAAAAAIAEGSSLTDAAATAGFADASHFSTSARRVFGVAPSDVLGAHLGVTIRA
ncbi:helix-turn-helix domain-containing protein [Agromyces atrinae]|uniref:AraC-like DNA-binding protein n=1 Tax=Agromyces atrinae TaxID=592376 RepID=A0A852S2Z1_9MICO|nr:AraC family transcriptional regulator [Agromyces atrinae]NYD66326.1 AraC-like DNA-binding protein [Agromyces atrinae]